MNRKYDNDDGLYTLIDDADDVLETILSNDSKFQSDFIDLNDLKINKNIKTNENLKNGKIIDFCNVGAAERPPSELSPLSKLINERAEANMGLYLPFNMKKNVLIGGGGDLRSVLCGECGERNVADVDWCLFCGVLLMGGIREVKSEGCEGKTWRKYEKEEFYKRNEEKNEKEVKQESNCNDSEGVKQVLCVNTSFERIREVKSEGCEGKTWRKYEKEEFYKRNEEKNEKEVKQESNCNDSEGLKQVVCVNTSIESVKDYDNVDIMKKRKSCEEITAIRNCGLREEVKEDEGNDRLNRLRNTRIIAESLIIGDSVRLDLNGVETSRSNGGDDWDFELYDDKTIDNRVNTCVNVVPPLDLFGVNSWRDGDNIVRVTGESKENKEKISRKWETSSTAWSDKPQSILQKKSSNYCRSKLNSFTNKIGVTVLQSKVVIEDVPNVEELPTLSNDAIKYQPSSILSNINKNNKNMSEIKESVRVEESNAVYRPPEIIDIKYEETLDVSLWQCLPAEIWIKIMKHLNHLQLSLLQQTCRRIYSIGLHSPLWKSINLYRHSTLNNDHIFYIARKKPNELHFKNCFGTYITVEGLKAMFKICGEGLKKISFISCSKGAFEDDRFLVLSASYCPNVTHVNASYLMNLHDETLETMIEGFTKIESLNIMGAHSISNKSIKSLTEHHRASLINLDLYGCFKLNSMTLTWLESCLNLRSLALGSIINLKRSALIGMLKKLSQLTILDLRGTNNLVDDSLLRQICQSCPNLQQIILTNSCRLTDDGLIELAKSCVSKSLNILDICGCSKITEKGLEEVLKYCHELEDLDISCTGIRGNSTKYFEIYCPPKLKCLRINNNKFISKDELVSLVRACKRLSTLYMCGSTSICSWRYIEEKFPNITFKHE